MIFMYHFRLQREFMSHKKMPGSLPHCPPGSTEQQRMLYFSPYVREAQEILRPAWHVKPRKLFDFLLIHWIDGSGEVAVGGQRFTVQSGDLTWIPPDTLHELRGDAPGTLLQFIHFDLQYDPQRSHWSARIPGGTESLSDWPERMHPPVKDPIIKNWCGKISGGNQAVVTDTLRRIILEYNRTRASGLMIAGLTNQLLAHLLDSRESSPDTPHIRTIEAAMQQIQLRGHEKLDIQTLARQSRLSPAHFRNLVREHYRQNPRTAHLNAKIRAACDYLIYSDLNISEIADRLGFTNVHNFSRAFRNAAGQSPSAYRSGKTEPPPGLP
jgi:AraC-like DNA-binding protein/mannose-6-phosphate isomerase-like protein (cupin superfamily)